MADIRKSKDDWEDASDYQIVSPTVTIMSLILVTMIVFLIILQS
jgi:hypothetical protein